MFGGKNASMPPQAPPKPAGLGGFFARVSQMFSPSPMPRPDLPPGQNPPPPPQGGGGFFQGLLARASMAPPAMPKPKPGGFLNRMTMKMGFGGGGGMGGAMGTRGSVPMPPPSSPPPGGGQVAPGRPAQSMAPGPPPRTTAQRAKFGPSKRMPMASMPMAPPNTPPPNQRRGNSRMPAASMPPPRSPPPNRGQSRMIQGGLPPSPRGQPGMRESMYQESEFYGDDEPVLEVVEVEEQPDAYGGPGTDFAFIILIRLKEELREVDRFVRDFQDFDQYLHETYPGITNFQMPIREPIPRMEDIDYCVEQLQRYLDDLAGIQYLVLDLADFLDVDPAELNEALYDSQSSGQSQYGGGGGAPAQSVRRTRAQSRYKSRATTRMGGGQSPGMGSPLGSPGGGMSPLMAQIQGGGQNLNHVSRSKQNVPQFGGGFGGPGMGGENDMMDELKRKVEQRLERLKAKRGGRPVTYMPSTKFGRSVPDYEPSYVPSRRFAPSKRFTARQLPSMRMNQPMGGGGGGGNRQSRFIRLPPTQENTTLNQYQQYPQQFNLPGV